MSTEAEELEQLERKLARGDKSPFTKLLARVLKNAPSETDLQRLAQRAPDRYFIMMKHLGAVAGFMEQSAVFHLHQHRFEEMSDMELRRYIREETARHPELLEAPKTVDVAPEEGT